MSSRSTPRPPQRWPMLPSAVCATSTVRFGVNVLWNQMSSWRLLHDGCAFCTQDFTGTYASDMGPWNPHAGAALALSTSSGAATWLSLRILCTEFCLLLYSTSETLRRTGQRRHMFSSLPQKCAASCRVRHRRGSGSITDLKGSRQDLPGYFRAQDTSIKRAT